MPESRNPSRRFLQSMTVAGSVLSAILLTFDTGRQVQAETYDFPAEVPRASEFQVQTNGQDTLVYDTEVAAIVTFGVSKETVVPIARKEPFTDFVVRPLNAAIPTRREQNMIELNIAEPVHLSVEFDGDIKRPLYVFANPPEDRPAHSDNLIYFGPGKIHRPGKIDLKSGETLFIAGGAIVQGYIRAENAENIRIIGPGILDASHRRDQKITSILLRACRDVTIRDTLLIDSFGWTVHLSQCEKVRIANMKQVGWRANSDGIDIEASRKVHVTGSFLRNADDCVAVKSKPKGDGRGIVTEDVSVERSVLWNSLPGNAMEIGFELRADAIRNVTFRDCDIIRVERGAAFSIHNGDNAVVENVLFENIRVEDVRGDFADMYIGLSIYSGDCPNPYRRSDPRRKRVPSELQDFASGDNRGQWIVPKDKSRYASNRGHIRNVTFRNIQFFPSEGDTIPPSLFIGYDPEHTIENVTFDGIFLHGQQVKEWTEGAITTRHAENIRFVFSDGR